MIKRIFLMTLVCFSLLSCGGTTVKAPTTADGSKISLFIHSDRGIRDDMTDQEKAELNELGEYMEQEMMRVFSEGGYAVSKIGDFDDFTHGENEYLMTFVIDKYEPARLNAPEEQGFGEGGVAIDTLEDMQILFDDIAIEKISTSLVTCQPICNITVQSMYFANAKLRDLTLDQLTGTSQNDFLMETVVTIAPEVLPPRASFKLSCDAIEFCTQRVPRWNPISFSGYNYRESGCTAVQEVAFVISNAMACCRELIQRGLKIDSFAPRLSFFLSAHNDFFEEIAKYRAARRIWYRIMKAHFAPEDSQSLRFRFHVQTAGVALTAQQPLNNIARAAYHGLAAVLGGAQSVHIDGYDEALCTPTELSALTALRTNQILQSETGVTSTIDPLGGSYFVESMTQQLEEKILELLEKIEDLGGIVKAVETGWIHNEISNAAYEYQQAVESGKMPIVGVNCHQVEEEKLPMELFEVPETLDIQAAKINKIKKKRNANQIQRALDEIAKCCDEDRNLMEVIVESVKSYVTEGEISRALKERYGTWTPPLF